MDPWSITAVERARHAEQFASLGPNNGFINGGQAKGFFMQSGLSPMILAQIWGLADINGDGQMDLNEFSIACKLINLKLKGFEIPSVLPQAILVIPQVAAPLAPVSNASMGMQHQPMMSMPVSSMSMTMPQQQMQMGMPMTSMPQQMQMGMPMTSMAMGHPQMMGMQQNQIPVSMVGMHGGMQGGMQGVMPMSVPMTMAGGGMMPGQVVTPVSNALASTPTEWSIPQPAIAKYTSVFQQTDKGRTGFLAGVQARNILLQSGLPQNILAQIWGLSDVDSDGRLSLEEFIVSGHLCDLASKGEALPTVLPPNMIPPKYRVKKGPGAGSETASTPGSISGETVGSPSTFEDKRKENFTKGQAELERRRQSLIDQQKKEEEERKKKEREEAEAREKQKKEMERQRLAEWEKTRREELIAHRQKEEDKLLELKARQTNLNKDLDAMRDKVKSLTTNIGESRTGVSDVKTFIDGMRSSRDTKMKDMNDLKAKLKEQNERLIIVTQEKAQLEARNKANATKIVEGEESTQLTDFEIKKIEKEKTVNELREKLKELKEKENVTKGKYGDLKQELELHKEDLQNVIKSCQELYSSFDEKRREIKAEKSKRIRELTDPDHAWGHEEPEGVPETFEAVAVEHGVVHYKALFDYEATNEDELTFHTGDVILASAKQTGEPGWFGGELNGKTGWFPEAYVELVAEGTDVAAVDVAPHTAVEREKARALFDWSADDTASCVSFVRGELVDLINQVEKDWWFVKKSDGSLGFVPSNYFLLDSPEPRGETPTETPGVTKELEHKKSDLYVAVYQYQSEEAGDLTFDVDDVILVINKEAEWWQGRIGERTGAFPFNFVEPLPVSGAVVANGGPVQDTTTNQHAATTVEEEAKESGTQKVAGSAPSSNTMSMKKKKKKDDQKKLGIATVVAPYEATSKEQLSLISGQMVLIRKKTETGWWQGEIQGDKGKKRQVGWFPASYVKLMESGGSKAPAAAPEPVKADGTVWLKAAFPYTGQHEDELSFEEGDKIALVSKEDADWWKGELDGKTGVFPSNYVEVLN